MEIEGIAFYYEYGEEALSMIQSYQNEGMYDNSSGDIQIIMYAAKLIPHILLYKFSNR